jgi:hypothetical protein
MNLGLISAEAGRFGTQILVLQVIGKILPKVALAVIKGSITTWLRYRTI